MKDAEQSRYEVLETGEPHEEAQSLLGVSEKPPQDTTHAPPLPSRSIYALYLLTAFFFGAFSGVLVAILLCHSCKSSSPHPPTASLLASPDAGSTEVHHFPPPAPTNADSSLFPSNIGYAGPTPTGAEPALVATAPAYPLHSGAPLLVAPNRSTGFDIFKKWGNLSPWYSVPRDAFGVDSGPGAPEGCRITGLHVLHRHGARYPNAEARYGGPAKLAGRLHAAAKNWTASGELEFLNDWTYKLGEEILTPFGRQQLYDLGVSLRLKYGYLLSNFTESNTIPVFRTESQDRMLASAMNFAMGFFGWPLEGKYQQSITIEGPGFNNTLAPYYTCPNAGVPSKANRSLYYIRKWVQVYLKETRERLQKQLKGYELSFEDVYTFQELCAYETVALGYSTFCGLFTEEEWDGFEYALDLLFWYDASFGSPVARAQGVGYLSELIARLTHTPPSPPHPATNATLNTNPTTFPLHDALYVDATHEVVVLNVLTALNLTGFARGGPLPGDRIPEARGRGFVASEMAPFATNMQVQLLACAATPSPQLRIVLNDGVVPLTGVSGCDAQKDGMCAVDAFVAAQTRTVRETDWEWACRGEWEVPPGEAWETLTGDAPPR